MIVFIIILLVMICSGLSAAGENRFFPDYSSQAKTKTINGIFTILIFFSHGISYLRMDGALDIPYFTMRRFMEQLVVVPYLFFSGYGIVESIRREKGFVYVREMPYKRLFRIWFHFSIAITLFVVLQIGIYERGYSIKDIFLAYTGWTSIGNSAWYMFAIFSLYIMVMVAFFVFRKSNVLAVFATCVLAIVYVLLMEKNGPSIYYYNTVLCFPLGMIFSLVKKWIDKIFMKNDVVWVSGFTFTVAAFIWFSENKGESFTHYTLFTFFAMATLLLFMMKVEIKSTVIDWFGNHAFSFFILQRLPMIVLNNEGYAKNGYFFLIVSFFATIALSTVFDATTGKIDSLLFRNK